VTFPAELTAVLSGATPSQLQRWRSTDLLRPEVQARPKVLYSFRDVVALRTFVRLRADVPLQRIRKALTGLKTLDLTDHPSRYQLHTDGDSVFFVEDDHAVDLVRRPGQQVLLSLADVFAAFTTRQGREVADFRHPRPLLEVRETKVGGWPTIKHTRVGFDSVAKLVLGGVAPEDVSRFYSAVSAAAAREAVDYYEEVQGMRRAA
jgi:uncharacterized protein (DUF433 family)/DNA-binding transcriptional MerR regulator